MRDKGKVYIIGAGPGDPGLITVKGRACLAEADVIVYDHLVSASVLTHAAKNARIIYAGKRGGDHTLSQGEINALLVEEAAKGLKVARLKGGDPFVFGRGGEEAETLTEAGIPFEVVPGVTSAVAVPAYAGIPLTHRSMTATVAFVTGHEDPTKDKSAIDWRALAGMGTIVFLMGVKNLSEITAHLLAAGKGADTPAALIRWGTTPDQETITATLATIAGAAEERRMTPPAILVVGEVCSLRDSLNWFETKPLFRRGIVITRPEAQAGFFGELLAAQGARVLPFPTIAIEPPSSWQPLDDALSSLASFQWIVFTSANGVRFFFQRLAEIGGDVRMLKGVEIAVIGPATAAFLETKGLKADLVPDRYISEGVVEAFGSRNMRGLKVLLVRAEEARNVIPRGLALQGAEVRVIPVYKTIRGPAKRETMEAWLSEELVDVVTFTSPSTVVYFREIMGPSFLMPEKVKVAAIGPVTAAAATKAGMTVHILQDEYTVPDMVESLCRHFAGR